VDRYVEGATTVSMTAWGLLAYLEVAEYIDVIILGFRLTIISGSVLNIS